MELKISFASRDDFVREWEKNITKGGIFIKTSETPAPRSRVAVSVEMAFKELSFELEGEAVHVAAGGVGVQLFPIPDFIKEDIRKILSGEAEEEEVKLELVEDDDDGVPEIVPSGESAPAKPAEEAEKAVVGTGPAPTADKVAGLSRNDRMTQARKGSMEIRAVLMRDRDPQVVLNVLLNPRLTIAEIIQLTGSGSIKLDHIKYILGKTEWMTNESVCLNIALNPKTPLPTALSLLPKLSEKNIRMIAKRPIKQQIKAAALKILSK